MTLVAMRRDAACS